VLVGLTILSTVSSCATWENKPYSGDPDTQSIYFEGDHSSDVVSCNEARFQEFICWHYLEVADLITILEDYKIKRKETEKVKALINILELKLQEYYVLNLHQ
jgi:hypothetical protein